MKGWLDNSDCEYEIVERDMSHCLGTHKAGRYVLRAMLSDAAGDLIRYG